MRTGISRDRWHRQSGWHSEIFANKHKHTQIGWIALTLFSFFLCDMDPSSGLSRVVFFRIFRYFRCFEACFSIHLSHKIFAFGRVSCMALSPTIFDCSFQLNSCRWFDHLIFFFFFFFYGRVQTVIGVC